VVVATDRAVERLALVEVTSGDLDARAAAPEGTYRGLDVDDGAVVAIDGAADRPTAIVRVDPGAPAEVLHAARELPVERSWLAVPETITFPTDDAVAHALTTGRTTPTTWPPTTSVRR
jgi:dipeptidyl aminopeptidase/acylaminoacyl peptidase